MFVESIAEAREKLAKDFHIVNSNRFVRHLELYGQVQVEETNIKLLGWKLRG
jgi:hypothetical protein